MEKIKDDLPNNTAPSEQLNKDEASKLTSASKDLERKHKRADYDLLMEKWVKWALLGFFVLSLLIILIVFIAYTYYLIIGKDMPKLENVAQTIIGVMIGNVLGVFTQSYLKRHSSNE